MADDNKVVTMYSGDWWTDQLDRDEKHLRDGWHNYADKVVKRYLGKKGEEDGALFNLFWSNVGILKAALYARPPRPMIKRAFDDPTDEIGRVASQILQRSLSQDLMKNVSPMSEAIKLAVEDRLIPGLGMLWLRYVPTIEPGVIPAVQHPLTGEEMFPATSYEEITHEECVTEYVHWRDVVFPSARTASEVWYLGRKLYLSYGEVKARFGRAIANRIKSTAGDTTEKTDGVLPKGFAKDKIQIYEIWCRKNRRVYWFSRHEAGGVLDAMADPLELDDFYPGPMPLIATHTTDNFMPRSDYTMLKDQYDQMTELNYRITILERALRVVGVYDKKSAELKRMLTDANENEMIPVDNWAMLSERGGVKGAVDWFPMDMVVAVLEKLMIQKQSKIDEIYMLSGISDIMRGDTNPRETLGTQQMKASFSSARLQYLQDEVATFVKQALIIKAEIICRHFQDESIMSLSQIGATPDAPYAPQAIEFLRDRKMTHFRVDINEESLALPDYAQEGESRKDFLKQIGQFLSQAAPLGEQFPGTGPYLIQMIKWVASGMKGSNEIQGVLDQMFQALQQEQAAKAQQPPQPDPKVQAEQIKLQGTQMKIQGEKGKAMAGMLADGANNKAKAEETAQTNATQILVAQQEGLNAEKAAHLQASTDILQERLQHVHRMNEIEAGNQGD